MTMPTPAEDAALSAFIDAATSDDDPGYPHGTAFIPWQQAPETDHVLWRYLHEGRPAVIVGTNDVEMLIEPLRVSPLGRLRNGPATPGDRAGLLSLQGSTAGPRCATSSSRDRAACAGKAGPRYGLTHARRNCADIWLRRERPPCGDDHPPRRTPS